MKTYSRKNSSYLKKAFIASNFNEMCRLCLSELDLGLTSIFQEFGKISYQEWIQYSVDVLIEEGDGLPPNVCEECLAMVEQTYLFKKKCKASDSKLREHLELLQYNQGGKLHDTELIDLTEDYANIFQKEESNDGKCDESSAVDSGGTEESLEEEQQMEDLSEEEKEEEKEEEPKEVPENTSADESIEEESTARSALFGDAEIDYERKEEKPVVNQVKRYILRAEKRNDDQEDLTMYEVIPLDVRNENLKPETKSYTTLNCVNLNGNRSETSLTTPQEGKIQEICQLWGVEDENETEQEETRTQEPYMILNVSWDASEVKPQNVGELDPLEEEEEDILQLLNSKKVEKEILKYPIKKTTYKCFACGTHLETGVELRRHLSTYHKEVADAAHCETCGKSFACSNNLKRHMATHTGHKPHKCKICGRRFSQGSILKRHVYTHARDKPFNCQICGKGYAQKTNLLSHFRSHGFKTAESTFNCRYCKKKFVHQSGLSRHSKVHQGIRFPCKQCPKSFGDTSALLRHVRCVHKSEDQSKSKYESENKSDD